MPPRGTGLAGELGFLRRDDPAAYSRAWRERNRAHTRAYARAYHARRKNDPAYKARRVDACRWTRRKRKYGITREEYMERLTRQGGLCDICGMEFGEDLRVDHDHSTGAVRGLLCANCNIGLGMFQEDPKKLTAAAEYLERHGKRE